MRTDLTLLMKRENKPECQVLAQVLIEMDIGPHEGFEDPVKVVCTRVQCEALAAFFTKAAAEIESTATALGRDAP